MDKFFDLEGNFFGFKWLSTFFWNVGIEVFTINIGLFILYGSFFMYEKISVLFRRMSYLLVSIGFFFIGWIFFDDTGISNTLEIIFSIAVGLPIAKISLELYKITLAYLKGLRFALSDVMNVIINEIPLKYLQDNMIKNYDQDTVYPTIKRVNNEIG